MARKIDAVLRALENTKTPPPLDGLPRMNPSTIETPGARNRYTTASRTLAAPAPRHTHSPPSRASSPQAQYVLPLDNFGLSRVIECKSPFTYLDTPSLVVKTSIRR